MTRYAIDGGIPTLAAALSEHLNVDELKRLATLTPTRPPTRKAELVAHICTSLRGDRLRTVWQGLDDLARAAIAEVVHSPGTIFAAERFRAKYGRLPDFGSPIIAGAPADPETRETWLERLWRAHEADEIPHIETLADDWGELAWHRTLPRRGRTVWSWPTSSGTRSGSRRPGAGSGSGWRRRRARRS
jgi:hypothetical protein